MLQLSQAATNITTTAAATIQYYIHTASFKDYILLATDSCLHTLLRPERNNEIFSKLRNPLKYPIPYSRTKKYQSFLNYALANFQNSM